MKNLHLTKVLAVCHLLQNICSSGNKDMELRVIWDVVKRLSNEIVSGIINLVHYL